jgi:hypothetical protein
MKTPFDLAGEWLAQDIHEQDPPWTDLLRPDEIIGLGEMLDELLPKGAAVDPGSFGTRGDLPATAAESIYRLREELLYRMADRILSDRERIAGHPSDFTA